MRCCSCPSCLATCSSSLFSRESKMSDEQLFPCPALPIMLFCAEAVLPPPPSIGCSNQHLLHDGLALLFCLLLMDATLFRRRILLVIQSASVARRKFCRPSSTRMCAGCQLCCTRAILMTRCPCRQLGSLSSFSVVRCAFLSESLQALRWL